MFKPTSIHDVVSALDALAEIERPEGDNEGDPINSVPVYGQLTPDEQDAVDRAVEVVQDYTRDAGGAPKKRNIGTMNRRGYDTYLGPDQYEPDRIVGGVSVGEWDVDLSDPSIVGDD